MKNKRTVLCLCVTVLCLFLLASCDFGGGGGKTNTGSKVTFTEEMIVNNPTKGAGLYVYSGKPITYQEKSFSFKVNGKTVPTSEFTFAYENNVDAGTNTAKLTITAKDSNSYCKGSVVLYFSIVSADVEAKTYTELQSILSNKNYKNVWVRSEMTIENDVVVPEGKILNVQGRGNVIVPSGKTLTNNGKIVVTFSQTTTGTRTSGVLTNRGNFLNDGSFSVESNGIFYQFGTFSSNSEVKNEGKIYVNDTAVPNVNDQNNGVQYVRLPLTADDIETSVDSMEYREGTVAYCPSVTVRNALYDAEFSDNTKVGTGKITVTVDEYDTKFYGQAVKEFAITKGKTNVTSLAEYRTKKETGNFDTFYLTAELNVPTNEVFEIEKGDTFDVQSHTIIVQGTFKINGNLASSTDTKNSVYKVNIEQNATAEINGSLLAEGGMWLVKGEGKNTASAKFSSLKTLGGGCFENAGNIETDSFGVDASSSFTNGKGAILSTAQAFCYGTVHNDGTVDFTGDTEFFHSLVFDNGENGTVTFEKGVSFKQGSLSNEGKVVNRGDFICREGVTIESVAEGFDNTQGTIWGYEAIENVTQNVNIKEKLSEENVSLSYLETYYDETLQKPSLSIDGEEITQELFSVEFSPASPIEVGTITVTVTCTEEKCMYGGSYETTYEILKGTYEVSSAILLTSRLSNTNYEKILLTSDITYGNKTAYRNAVTLAEGITLDTNGYTLTLEDVTFTNKGVLDNSAGIGAEKKCGLLLGKDAVIQNYGEIRNNNYIVLSQESSSLSHATSEGKTGTLFNNGKLYCGQTSPDVLGESTGSIVNRTGFLTLADNLSIDGVYYYTGSAIEPVVTYSATDDFGFSSFTFSYLNNVNVGTISSVIVHPDLFNEKYYGDVSVPFSIQPTVKTVTSAEELISFCGTSKPNTNYYEIKLGASLTLTQSVTVPSVFDFNFSLYTVTYANGAHLIFTDRSDTGSEIFAEADSTTTFLQNLYNVDTLKVIDSFEDLRVDVSVPDYVSDLGDAGILNGGTTQSVVKFSSVTVDLNGCSIPSVHIVHNKRQGYSMLFKNSLAGTTESVIGNVDVYSCGFVQEEGIAKTITVNIENCTVAGIELNGNVSGVAIMLTVQNCDVKKDKVVSSSQYQGSDVYVVDVSYKNVYTFFEDCEFYGYYGCNFNYGINELDDCTFDCTQTFGNGEFWKKGNYAKVTIDGQEK